MSCQKYRNTIFGMCSRCDSGRGLDSTIPYISDFSTLQLCDKDNCPTPPEGSSATSGSPDVLPSAKKDWTFTKRKKSNKKVGGEK